MTATKTSRRPANVSAPTKTEPPVGGNTSKTSPPPMTVPVPNGSVAGNDSTNSTSHLRNDTQRTAAGAVGSSPVRNTSQMRTDAQAKLAGVVDDPTIYDLVAEWSTRFQSLDAVKVAHRCLASIEGDAWRTTLLPLVTAAVENHRRAAVRRAEQSAFTGRKGTGRPVEVTAGGYEPNIDELRALLRREFAVGGTKVAWGKATVEEHQARIEAQRKHADGVLADISRHEMAVALIVEAGVKCLNEVDKLNGGTK